MLPDLSRDELTDVSLADDDDALQVARMAPAAASGDGARTSDQHDRKEPEEDQPLQLGGCETA